MRAGALRHKVTIQYPTVTKTDGVSITTWSTFKVVNSQIEMMRSFDRANAQAIWPGADYTISIRWIPGVTGNMRIVDENGVIYSILGSPEDVTGRHRELVMTCQSGVKGQ